MSIDIVIVIAKTKSLESISYVWAAHLFSLHTFQDLFTWEDGISIPVNKI